MMSSNIQQSKRLEDYLHLYLGCQMLCVNGNSDLEYKGLISKNSPLLLDKYCNRNWKPIFRPLSSMTLEERKERGKELLKLDKSTIDAEYNRWMLKKGFDLFGLIEAGLAIDKTKLNS